MRREPVSARASNSPTDGSSNRAWARSTRRRPRNRRSNSRRSAANFCPAWRVSRRRRRRSSINCPAISKGLIRAKARNIIRPKKRAIPAPAKTGRVKAVAPNRRGLPSTRSRFGGWGAAEERCGRWRGGRLKKLPGPVGESAEPSGQGATRRRCGPTRRLSAGNGFPFQVARPRSSTAKKAGALPPSRMSACEPPPVA